MAMKKVCPFEVNKSGDDKVDVLNETHERGEQIFQRSWRLEITRGGHLFFFFLRR